MVHIILKTGEREENLPVVKEQSPGAAQEGLAVFDLEEGACGRKISIPGIRLEGKEKVSQGRY